LPRPTREGYEFASWYVRVGTHLITEIDITSESYIEISASHVAFARWEPVESGGPHTITFDPNGGVFEGADQLPSRAVHLNEPDNTPIWTYGQAIDSDSNLVNPNWPRPTKDGYEFAGWYVPAAIHMITLVSRRDGPIWHESPVQPLDSDGYGNIVKMAITSECYIAIYDSHTVFARWEAEEVESGFIFTIQPTIRRGQTATPDLTVFPASEPQTAHWTVSNPNLVTIVNQATGEVRANAASGIVIITATSLCGNYSHSETVRLTS